MEECSGFDIEGTVDCLKRKDELHFERFDATPIDHRHLKKGDVCHLGVDDVARTRPKRHLL